MDEIVNTQSTETSVTATPDDVATVVPEDVAIPKEVAPESGRRERGKRDRGGRGRRDDRGPREPKEFEQVTLDLARVTRVTKGGKRMRFRATVVVGDGKGRVGFATAKGLDVQAAVSKASTRAKKRVITIPLVNQTIPHTVRYKSGAADVLVKPAPKGSGIIAGGAVRVVLQLAGVPNASSKILGSKNKINNVRACIGALSELRKRA